MSVIPSRAIVEVLSRAPERIPCARTGEWRPVSAPPRAWCEWDGTFREIKPLRRRRWLRRRRGR